jgi:hypothetical protein
VIEFIESLLFCVLVSEWSFFLMLMIQYHVVVSCSFTSSMIGIRNIDE